MSAKRFENTFRSSKRISLDVYKRQALSGATHSGEDHDGKGLHYKKQDCPDVHLNWEKVAKRITDVYKRQSQGCRPFCPSCGRKSGAGAGGPASDVRRSPAPYPVSYTHLDVYKRQVLLLKSRGRTDDVFCEKEENGRMASSQSNRQLST